MILESITLRKVLNFIDTINDLAGKIFSWTIAVITLLVVLEIILRRFLNRPTLWSFEVVIQLYALHFMMLASYSLLHRSHVVVDVIYEKMNPRLKAFLGVACHLIFFFPFLSIVLYEGIKFAANAWAIFERSQTAFGAPLYLIKTIIPIMAFLLLIQGSACFIRLLHLLIKGDELC
jgi:TRAP-type mannitol/chloroaromatic compound transport system permease small subunit